MQNILTGDDVRFSLPRHFTFYFESKLSLGSKRQLQRCKYCKAILPSLSSFPAWFCALVGVVEQIFQYLTYHGPFHYRPIVSPGENRAVVIDVCHLDDKVSGILDQISVPIIHPGSQVVQVLLLSVQSFSDKQVSFVIHDEDGICAFAFDHEALPLQLLA